MTKYLLNEVSQFGLWFLLNFCTVYTLIIVILLIMLKILCRWRDVKMRAFDNAKHRTYVDLKVRNRFAFQQIFVFEYYLILNCSSLPQSFLLHLSLVHILVSSNFT